MPSHRNESDFCHKLWHNSQPFQLCRSPWHNWLAAKTIIYVESDAFSCRRLSPFSQVAFMLHKLIVFISSTADLKGHRDAVEKALSELEIDGSRFESWPSVPTPHGG